MVTIKKVYFEDKVRQKLSYHVLSKYQPLYFVYPVRFLLFCPVFFFLFTCFLFWFLFSFFSLSFATYVLLIMLFWTIKYHVYYASINAYFRFTIVRYDIHCCFCICSPESDNIWLQGTFFIRFQKNHHFRSRKYTIW